MTMRAGIDLVCVEDVRESLRRHADRYLQRVFTEREVADCGGPESVSPDRLAARFAAKEAARKVLRVDRESVPWRAIEVRREPGGWTELELHGAAAELAERSGMSGFSVSLTHEAGFASAVVIAEVTKISR
jgi:holo-[acyl-carrier protein] synthase